MTKKLFLFILWIYSPLNLEVIKIAHIWQNIQKYFSNHLYRLVLPFCSPKAQHSLPTAVLLLFHSPTVTPNRNDDCSDCILTVTDTITSHILSAFLIFRTMNQFIFLSCLKSDGNIDIHAVTGWFSNADWKLIQEFIASASFCYCSKPIDRRIAGSNE